MTWAIERRATRSGAPVGWSGCIRRPIAMPPGGRMTPLRGAAARACLERRRFGYRRLGLLLAREGIKLNHKKLYRLYREERLTVRKRGGRKRALGTRAPMASRRAQPALVARLRGRHAHRAAGASASSPSSTTSPGNAWRWSSTPRSRGCGSCASWTGWSSCAAIPA